MGIAERAPMRIALLSALLMTQALTAPLHDDRASRDAPPKSVIEAAKKRLFMSYAAYCKPPAINDWSCRWCEKLPKLEVMAVVGDHVQGTQAYIAIDTQMGEISVAFRGSSNIINWIQNVAFPVMQLPWPGAKAGVKVHSGFYDSYNSIRGGVVAAVNRARGKCPSCTLNVLGHSLGGAQALLCALDLTLQGLKVSSVYTFGCPRVGDPRFANWWDDVVGNHYRSVHYRDIVPHVPPYNFVVSNAFVHTNRELWQTGENGSYALCQVMNGTDGGTKKQEDPKCSFQYNFAQGSISDHTAYYGIQTSVTNPCAGADGPCIADGECADAGSGSSCCSERVHSTLTCPSHGRCGCLVKGVCADKQTDCCSGKGHKTAACSLGIGFRCD